ncbi:hypothetical protein [Skermanella aerolata]|nr:hypothetical protein [Skermanella aerolata]
MGHPDVGGGIPSIARQAAADREAPKTSSCALALRHTFTRR